MFVFSGSFAAAGQDESTSTTVAQTTTSSETTTTTAETTSTTAGTNASSQSTTATTAAGSEAGVTTSTADDSAAKARAVANLNLAKAADVEIARGLNEINAAANETLEKIDEANLRIEQTDAILDRTAEELEASGRRQTEIESDLRVKAIEGFKTRTLGGANPLLTDMDLNRAIRQNGLLEQASLSTAELLEELRAILEERRLANAEAEQAKADAEAAEEVLQQELALLKDQQAAQLELKAEAERRVDIWAGELTAYAREDAAIQRVIVEKSGKTPVTTTANTPAEAAPAEAPPAVNTPAPASTSGFQWPINARVTSEYGYRVHPVYGSRRLHAGMDIGAAGGTPIASANTGVVIFAGRQGGYGNTIIVDHGGGITTLYAHQSRLGASVGQSVNRGDIIGYVGATGTATGNHLHFEVRVNGSPTNPRNYLP
ncbi:MAG: peptidoglycan DD-metalloendopeptidase family protein [Acidimicrobiia bacterium]|nr:peptidoglycan DD-metalloendopeptidase family protein [Acidimicrobiia bacterium]